MPDLAEELKSLRNSQPKEPLKIEDIEIIAKKTSDSEYCSALKKPALVNRLKPQCYTSFSPANINILNLHEETLFYIFYALPESELQLNAYNSLIKKGYLYSRQLEAFVMLMSSKVVDGKKKNIVLFDPCEWKKMSKDVVFDDKFIGSLESFADDEFTSLSNLAV